MYEIIDQSSVNTPPVLATDCACAGATTPRPRSVPRQPTPPQLLQQVTVPPRLHREPLQGTHWALFDPDGEGGVIVVNEATYNLLSRCAAGATAALASSSGDQEVDRDAIGALVELGVLVPLGAQTRAAAPKPQALSAWLHMTNDCNMRCSYCYVQKTGQAMHETTAPRAVDAVVRSAVHHDYREVRLKYAGGEPTLRLAQVLSLHDYAAKTCDNAQLRLSATLLSNGSLFTQRAAAEIKQRAIEVMISLDGVGEKHDVQRPLRSGQPSFSLVKTGIERLLAAGLRPHLSITLTAHNCDNAVEAVAFALAHDCTFALNLYRSSPAIPDRDALQLEQQAVIAAYKRVFALLEDAPPMWSVLGAVLDRGHLLAPHEHAACGVARDYMVIDHHGQVAKCQMTIGEPITDVADQDPLGALRLSPVGIQNVPAAEKTGCRDCAWQRWCSGGCPLLTYEATGRYNVQSPYCDVYQAIYGMAVRVEGMRLLRYGHARHMH